MGKCPLVLIFYNCLFGLLGLFFRIRRIQDHSLARSDIPPDWCILYSNHIVRRRLDHSDSDCTFSPIRPGMPSPSESVGVGSDLYSGQPPTSIGFVNHSVGASMRTLHKCNSLCGFLLRFVGLRHRGGEKLQANCSTS